jgi:hypothetical protein
MFLMFADLYSHRWRQSFLTRGRPRAGSADQDARPNLLRHFFYQWSDRRGFLPVVDDFEDLSCAHDMEQLVHL